MEQKRCPKCGYMNHPQMEFCLKCGQKMKGILSGLNLSSDTLQDKAIELMMQGNANVSKEKLLQIFEEKAVNENISPILKQKIKDAISRSDFTKYEDPGFKKWERQNIQKKKINLIIAATLGLLLMGAAVMIIVLTRVSTP